jgi:hypothetical protein
MIKIDKKRLDKLEPERRRKVMKIYKLADQIRESGIVEKYFKD